MTRYQVSRDAMIASLEGGTVLLHLDTKRYYSLNETGALIWRLLESGETDERMLECLLETYDVSPAEASATLADLLARLTSARLVSPREE